MFLYLPWIFWIREWEIELQLSMNLIYLALNPAWRGKSSKSLLDWRYFISAHEKFQKIAVFPLFQLSNFLKQNIKFFPLFFSPTPLHVAKLCWEQVSAIYRLLSTKQIVVQFSCREMSLAIWCSSNYLSVCLGERQVDLHMYYMPQRDFVVINFPCASSGSKTHSLNNWPPHTIVHPPAGSY